MNITQIILIGLGLIVLRLAIRSFRRPISLDPAAFTRDYVARLLKAKPDAKAKIIADLEVEVSLPGGEPLRAFLNNAFNDFIQAPDRKNAILDGYIRALQESRATITAQIDPARIVPVIRDQRFLDESAALPGHAPGKSVELAHDQLNEELLILYVADSEHSVRYLSEEDLLAAKVDRRNLARQAMENLRRLYPEVRVLGTKGIFMARLDGTYESSLLLSDSFWSNPQLEVAGEIVVAVPTRDLLLITGTQETEGMTALRNIIAETSANGSHRISEKLFVRRDGKFEIWE